MVFGAILAALCRAARRRVEPRSVLAYAAAAVGVAIAVVVLGVIAFLPVHAIHALGVPEDAIVAAHFVGCAAVALTARPTELPLSMPRALRPVPLALPLWHLVVLAWLASHAAAAAAPAKLAAIAAAGAASWWLATTKRPAPRSVATAAT
jgi:hypothetical protein